MLCACLYRLGGTAKLIAAHGAASVALTASKVSDPIEQLTLQVATGVTIAACSIVDGLGVRRSASPVGYAGALFLAEDLAIVLGVIILAAVACSVTLTGPGGSGSWVAWSRSAPIPCSVGRPRTGIGGQQPDGAVTVPRCLPAAG